MLKFLYLAWKVRGHIYASGASIVPLTVICLLNFELFGHVVNLFVLIFQSIAYQRVSHLEQELITLQEQPFSPPGFNRVRVARSLVCCVMFYTSLFFWPLCCLSFFDLRLLITPLVSPNFFSCTLVI